MLFGLLGPQDPSEQKKHVLFSKLSNNSLRTDPNTLWGYREPKMLSAAKMIVLRPELPKNSLQKASDIPFKLPDSNMTNPLTLS